MNPRSIHLPTFPSQIVEEVAPGLDMVYVIPVRNPGEAAEMEQFLLQLPSPGHQIEAILVIHSFAYEGDEIKKTQLNFYWEMEQRKQHLKDEGIGIHLVNYIGLDQVYEPTLLPFFIGMDEALQRLSDAGNINGVITLMEGSEKLSEAFSATLLKYYQLFPEIAAAESERLFDLDAAGQDADTFNALVSRELDQRLHGYLLQLSNYPVMETGTPCLFSIRAWMYRQIDRSALPARVCLRHLFHEVRQLGGKAGMVRSVAVTPNTGKPPHSKRLENWIEELHAEVPCKTFDLKCYEQLSALIAALPHLYHASSFDDYQRAIKKLPQPAVAYLSETSFFEIWQAMRASATNYEQFKRAFFGWLDPGQLLEMLHFSASHFHQYNELHSVAAAALHQHLGIRSAVMDNEQLLYCLRKKASGLAVATIAGRA